MTFLLIVYLAWSAASAAAAVPAPNPRDPSANNSTTLNSGQQPASLSVLLEILLQMQTEELLSVQDGLGLTLCGEFDVDNRSWQAWRSPVTLRTCHRCRDEFRAELLQDEPMLPRALLLGAGCHYWPGAQPLTHWSPRPAALLGGLDCRNALLRPELGRLPDLLCLQMDGGDGRLGRLFRRTFAMRAVREVGTWSATGGLRVTDRRTGVQANGHIITDGTPVRVAYMNLTKRHICRKNPDKNGTCSSVDYRTPMPLFHSTHIELDLLLMMKSYNLTLEYIDSSQLPTLPRRYRFPPKTSRAVRLLSEGGADRTWPYLVLMPDLFRMPVTMEPNTVVIPYSFITVRRPPQLDAGSLLRLLSPATWAAVVGSTVVVAALLMLTMRRGSPGAPAAALALLLGQGVPIDAGRLPSRHRPLVAVWVAMSLVLTTAYLSDLVGILTIPRDQSPRTARDLFDQGYNFITDYGHQNIIFSQSRNPYVRRLARTMRYIRPRQEIMSTLLNERVAYPLNPRALTEFTVYIMRRSKGTVLFEDFNFGKEILLRVVVGRLWSKYHPLIPAEQLSTQARHASGLDGKERFQGEARYIGIRIKSRACALRLPICYKDGVVRPLGFTSVRGPLIMYGFGTALAMLALLTELIVSRLNHRKQADALISTTTRANPMASSSEHQKPTSDPGPSGIQWQGGDPERTED